MRLTAIIFAVYFVLNGLYLFFAPMQFYTNTPGVASMGPFNFHFIIDVSLAFFVAAAGLLWGALRHQRATAVVGAAWPFLHALFHLQIWGKREFVMDAVSQSDFAAVIIPGLLAMLVASRIKEVAS